MKKFIADKDSFIADDGFEDSALKTLGQLRIAIMELRDQINKLSAPAEGLAKATISAIEQKITQILSSLPKPIIVPPKEPPKEFHFDIERDMSGKISEIHAREV